MGRARPPCMETAVRVLHVHITTIVAGIQSGVASVVRMIPMCLLSFNSVRYVQRMSKRVNVVRWISMCCILGQFPCASSCTTAMAKMPSGPDNVIRLVSNYIFLAQSMWPALPPCMEAAMRLLHGPYKTIITRIKTGPTTSFVWYRIVYLDHFHAVGPAGPPSCMDAVLHMTHDIVRCNMAPTMSCV